MAALLLTFVIRKARTEFNKAIQEVDQSYKPLPAEHSTDHMEKGILYNTKENPVTNMPNGDAISPRHSLQIHKARTAAESATPVDECNTCRWW